MRIKEYFTEHEAYVLERLTETSAALEAGYTRQGQELLTDFTDSFDEVFLKTAQMQRRGEKGAITWICISYLRSSMLTKSNDLRIDLYDADFYLDVKEAAGYWNGAFVYQNAESDMAYFMKMARKKLIRVTAGEIKFFMNDYFYHYADFLKRYCQRHLPQILALESYERLEKTPDIKFTFGEYLDKTMIIYPGVIRKEQVDHEGASDRN